MTRKTWVYEREKIFKELQEILNTASKILNIMKMLEGKLRTFF